MSTRDLLTESSITSDRTMLHIPDNQRCTIAFIALAIVFSLTAFAQGVLTNGGNQDGTLAVNTTNAYTVTASAGDRIALQIAKLTGGAGFTPRIEWLAPDGATLGFDSGGTAARRDVQAHVGGTYTLRVSDVAGTGSGTYRLRLAQVPGIFTVPGGDEGGSLTNGVNHQGTIDPGDFDMWTVSANQGDRITIQIGEVSGGAGFTPMIELFGPDGARLGVDSDGLAARLDAQAAVVGIYTVLVSDFSESGTGSYELHLAQVPGSFVVPAGDEGGALSDGVDANGTILLGDLDQWTFTAAPGDLVTLQITELTGGANFAPMIELFAPNGQRKGFTNNASTATLTAAIEAGGTYAVLVSDASQIGAGTYRLRLTRGSITPPGANVLTNGAVYLGAVSSAGQTNSWTFTASAGETVIVRMGETATAGLVPWLRLYGPDGALLSQNFNASAAEVVARATNSGTFSVTVADGSAGGNQTGNYRISLAKTGSPLVISPSDEGGALTNGATYLATLDTGDIDGWTFTANAGETVIVRMGESATGTMNPWLRLYGPNGVLLSENYNAAAAEVNARVTNSGTFMVVAGDGNTGFAGSGNYRISLAKTGSPLAISPSDEGGALTNGPTYLATLDTGDIDAWTFTANAGETVVVRMGESATGTMNPWLRLYGPDGVLLSEDYNATAAEVNARATNSGTFMVVAGDGSAGVPGSGNYRISLAKTGSALVISPSDEGGPIANGTTYLATLDTGDIDAWTFTANVGETVIVRVGESATGTMNPWLRLYGPNGVLLSEDYNAAAAEVSARATNNGTFMVVAGDGSPGIAGSGNYRISLAKTGEPVLISPGDEGGTMTNGATYLATIDTGDIDAWTFTANVGESIVVRMGETTANSPLLPWLRLYGPNGVLLNANFNAAAAEVTVRATNSGTFLVVATDGNNGFFGTGNYRISLAKAGSPLVVSPGDEGGPMTGTGLYDGTIETGDIDAWTFTVCAGDILSISVTELVAGSPLTPWMRLYGWDGVLLSTLFASATVQLTNYPAPASGTYTVVVGDGNNGLFGTGTYRLTVNGLADELKLCVPRISGTNVNVIGIGGVPGGDFILLTTTNVATTRGLWTPILSDQFDLFGVMNFTNLFNPAEPQRFFLLQTP